MDIYFDRIKPLFDQSGMTDAELERLIGIPAKKISQWNIRYTKSYTKYIPQIAAYFHVSTDYLLGNTDDPQPAGGQKKEADSLAETDFKPTREYWEKAVSKMSKEEMRVAMDVLMKMYVEDGE